MLQLLAQPLVFSSVLVEASGLGAINLFEPLEIVQLLFQVFDCISQLFDGCPLLLSVGRHL